MMGRLAWAAAAAIIGFSAATASAARDLSASGVTRQEVADWLRGHNYAAKLHDDSNGRSILTSATQGVNFDIYFYGCDGAGRCEAIQYAAGWSGTELDPEKLNAWNRDQRYLRSYRAQDGGLWAEYDVEVAPGGTWEGLDQSLARWNKAITTFKTYIGN